MRIETVKIIVANSVAVINGILLIYSLLVISKKDYLKSVIISASLQTVPYLICGYYSSVAANIFSVCRDMYIANTKKKRIWVAAAIVLVGGVLSAFSNLINSNGTLLDYLPTISIVGYSTGMLLSKDASQMKIVNAVDICLWIVFDFTHHLVVNVVLDLVIILSAFATQYVKLDRDGDK